MAYSYSRKRHRLRKQYTLTRTKAAVAFILSVACSILLSTYFENIGRDAVRKSATAMQSGLSSVYDRLEARTRKKQAKKVKEKEPQTPFPFSYIK